MNLDFSELLQLNQPLPRYTSYPTAPEWTMVEIQEYETRLTQISDPIALYIHVPFCKTMCLYCACSVVLNRRPENEARYVQYLIREIELLSQHIGRKKIVQLHFGGGTPTQLSEEQFSLVFAALQQHFFIEEGAEIAIEIDPRTVGDGKKLAYFKNLGFNRVSFGVQDTNSEVQAAVHRYQSYEMTRDTFLTARELGFKSINIDLIYGLPYQTVATFQETVEKIIELGPDRIALFSYAKVPWLKPHQKAIREETLPTLNEKFSIYQLARSTFIHAGYQAIGMDHFARQDDELARAYHQKKLQRNFQGYSTFPVDTMVGLGMTAIGYIDGMYVQNRKELNHYYEDIDKRVLPIERGKILNRDDHIRRSVIQSLMCRFIVKKWEFYEQFACSFDEYFAEEKQRALMHTDLVEDQLDVFVVTKKGELFIRNIAACFDFYLHQKQLGGQFSQSI